MSASRMPFLMGNISLPQNSITPEYVYLSNNDGGEFKTKYFTIKKLWEKGILKCDSIKEFMELVEAE